MHMTGNTIFITGGGSGIGRGLAEAFHRLGNKVIISGRRAERLKATVDANSGMVAVELDVSDPASITRVAADLIVEHPSLNVLINNAGIMLLDNVGGAVDEHLLVSTVTTNFGGPVRLSAALIDHLKMQANPVIVNVTSVLGFVPLVPTAIYSAMKALSTPTPCRSATRCGPKVYRSSSLPRPGSVPNCSTARRKSGRCLWPPSLKGRWLSSQMVRMKFSSAKRSICVPTLAWASTSGSLNSTIS